jgi:hypothetical protein
MLKKTTSLFLYFSFVIPFVFGQVPKQNTLLHYINVYFEDDFLNNATDYELIVYGDSLKTKPLQKLKNKIPAFNVNGLEWTKSYWWVVRTYDQDKLMNESDLRKFSIGKKNGALNVLDTRFEVKTNKTDKHNGGYILLDHGRGIFDRYGKQLWALPATEGLVDERKLIRDVKLTPDNTITFLAGPVPVEIDFEGNVIWKAPYPFMIGADTVTYHHDFRKMPNGHYYVLGNRKVARKVIGDFSDDKIKDEIAMRRINGALVKKTLLGMLMEFDADGKLVWCWDVNDYVTDEDLNYKKNENGLPSFATHMNAFSVNKANTKAYVGFRDLCRIVRIDKKTKKVEFSYGEKYPSGEARTGNNLLMGQHDASITDRGTILVFNNNSQLGKGGTSSVLELKDVNNEKENVLIWKFDLNFDTLTDGKSTAAGNVTEQSNGNLLVGAGTMPRLFEVTKSKEIVWDVFPYYKVIQDSSKWSPFAQYRCYWTPQLYFYHFLPRVVSQNWQEKRVDLTLELFNTGNANDVYKIEVFSEIGEPLYTKATETIKQNEMRSQTIKVKCKSASQKITVKISSTRNKPLVKTLTLNRK